MEQQSTLILSNLAIGYGSDKILAKEINLIAQEGELISIMGLNGTGKTSLFKTILSQIPCLAGSVSTGNSELKRHELISAVFTERVSIFGFTVTELIAQGRAPHTNIFGKLSSHDKRLIQEQIEALDLSQIADSQINSLSDGQFQKVMIARALAQETPIMLLDEPAAFLDVKNRRIIYKLLSYLAKEKKKTILVSTHDVGFAQEYCQKAWVIQNQKIGEMDPKKISESFFD